MLIASPQNKHFKCIKGTGYPLHSLLHPAETHWHYISACKEENPIVIRQIGLETATWIQTSALPLTTIRTFDKSLKYLPFCTDIFK